MDKIYRLPKDPSGLVTDQELVDAIVQRDPHAMALLFARHSVSIYRFVVRLSGDQSLAEDVVSDVFLDVWRGANKFRGSSRVSTISRSGRPRRSPGRAQVRLTIPRPGRTF